MDCVLVAGGRPGPDDPLFTYTQGGPKALLEIAGRPIIDYVLQALLQAQTVDRIVVVGLPKDSLGDYGPLVDFLDDQGGMVANGLAGLAWLRQLRPETRHVLFATADIPAATGPLIDDVVSRRQPLRASAYYFFVERSVMESSFPGARRTYVRLRDAEIAGADIVIADASLADGNTELFDALSAGREQAWKLARIAGLSTIVALLTHRLTVSGIERRATKVLGTPASVSVLEHPQLAMDIDKPEHLLLFRDLLT